MADSNNEKQQPLQTKASGDQKSVVISTTSKDADVLRRFENWERQHKAGKMSIDIR